MRQPLSRQHRDWSLWAVLFVLATIALASCCATACSAATRPLRKSDSLHAQIDTLVPHDTLAR